MKKVSFTNADKSSMSAGLTQAERQFQALIETEYSDAAIEASNALKALYDEGIDRVQEGFFGAYVLRVLAKVPRYVYIKNKSADGAYSEDSDVCIDLIAHQFSTATHK